MTLPTPFEIVPEASACPNEKRASLRQGLVAMLPGSPEETSAIQDDLAAEPRGMSGATCLHCGEEEQIELL